GGGQNSGGGPIVLLELDDFDGGKIFFEFEEVGDFRAAPAVNALVVVADDAEVAVGGGEMVDEAELGGVGVLVFIDHDVAIFGATGFEGVGVFAEEAQGEEDKIVKVNGVAGVEGALVLEVDVAGEGADIGIGENLGPFAAVFVAAQKGEDGVGIDFLALVGDVAQDLLDGGKLLGFAVNNKIALEAEFLDVLAEYAHAQGMEGADGGAARFAIRAGGAAADQLADTLLHLARGLVGESDGEDVVWSDAFLDEARDAGSDDAGFAGAGAGEDQDGAFGGFDGLALRRVEGQKIEHVCRLRSWRQRLNTGLTAEGKSFLENGEKHQWFPPPIQIFKTRNPTAEARTRC